ncbi:MAG: hypothetical protein ACLQU3_15115 [Limisphaerales bacterium]
MFRNLTSEQLIEVVALLFVAASAMSALGVDTVLLKSGTSLTGTVVRTNGDDILLVTDCAAFNFWRGSIREIKTEQGEAVGLANTNRLSPFKVALTTMAQQSWSAGLRPVPATVIDKGILKNVPYSSFQCGDDYEVNIYGEPEHPAGIEIGVYRKLLDDAAAKSNCLNFAAALLGAAEDRDVLRGLNVRQDLKVRDGLTFEITPPSAEDAYLGWWVSVYSEQRLNAARASDDDMKRITVAKAAVAQRQQPQQAQAEAEEDPTSWSARDLPYARPAPALAVTAPATAVAPITAYQPSSTPSHTPLYRSSYKSKSSSGSDGSVYVRGYYRQNGTYVNSYTRHSPP